MYQLLIFDWDGTIIDSADKIANCLQASARDVGIAEPSTKAAKGIIGLGLAEAMQVLFPEHSIKVHQAVIEAYRHHFVTADTTQQALFRGVEAGLEALSTSGALLAVATGKSRVGLDRALNEHQLGSHFVTSRCADETRSKPHPQMLHEILEFTAIDPHKAIMIGDTSFDMEMAKNAGVHGLGAGYGVHTQEELLEHGATSVLDSFEDVVSWLQDGRLQVAY